MLLINILETLGLVALILVGVIVVAFLTLIAAAIITSGIKYISGGGKANGRKDR